MNLLGYFFRDLLKANLTDSTREKTARKMQGSFLFDATGMHITVVFRKDVVEIQPGKAAKVNGGIRGDLNTLLEVALGGGYVRYLLMGKIKIHGNVFKLLKLLEVLRVPP
ncbi:MAG: SCP2 sterol-binding domain-containing protein [bacterium]